MNKEELLEVAELLKATSISVICDSEMSYFNVEDEADYLKEIIEISLCKLSGSSSNEK